MILMANAMMGAAGYQAAAAGTGYTWLLKTTSSDAAYQMESAGATANWEAVYDADGTLIENATGEDPVFDLSGNTGNAIVAIRTTDAITASATDVASGWREQFVTSFDASALTSVTNCSLAWLGNQLTLFDASALTSVTDCNGAWFNNQLTSFDASALTSVTDCSDAWHNNQLTSFDASALTSVTNCSAAWHNNQLTSFDASGFATMGAPAPNCFFFAWTGGTNALDQASVESIFVNIDLSGQNAPAFGTSIDISSDGSTLTSAAQTAVTSLKAKGWVPTVNGVAL